MSCTTTSAATLYAKRNIWNPVFAVLWSHSNTDTITSVKPEMGTRKRTKRSRRRSEWAHIVCICSVLVLDRAKVAWMDKMPNSCFSLETVSPWIICSLHSGFDYISFFYSVWPSTVHVFLTLGTCAHVCMCSSPTSCLCPACSLMPHRNENKNWKLHDNYYKDTFSIHCNFSFFFSLYAISCLLLLRREL